MTRPYIRGVTECRVMIPASERKTANAIALAAIEDPDTREEAAADSTEWWPTFLFLKENGWESLHDVDGNLWPTYDDLSSQSIHIVLDTLAPVISRDSEMSWVDGYGEHVEAKFDHSDVTHRPARRSSLLVGTPLLLNVVAQEVLEPAAPAGALL
jgi:hypothetical protein